MNKILRIIIPFIVAFLMVGMLIWLMGSPHQALAYEDSISKSRAGKELTKRYAERSNNMLVTTLDDELNTDGDCSLREAITAANNNTPVDACTAGDVLTDTITFDVAGIITVTSQLSVTASGPLVIDGGDIITTSGGGTTRVWWVETGSELTLQRIAVGDGFVVGSGAGLFNNGADVIIDQCKFIGNIYSGGWFYGGGIYAGGGTINVIDSHFQDNRLGSESFGSGGGIAFRNATGFILRSNFLNNTGGGCGGFGCDRPGGGGISLENSSVTIQDSSFISNASVHNGGGIAIGYNSSLTITNTIISGNTSELGGGIANIGSITIINSTLSGNSGWVGGGIFNGGNLTAINSIVANSQLGVDCDGYDYLTDGGHNISSDDSCGFDPANGSMPNTDPLLGPLQDNGGPTLTHALLWGSPAIDAGDDAQCPPTDQRGIPRPLDGDGDGMAVCDIGSYELESSPVPPAIVTIAGASEGILGQVVNFTATVEPVSTTVPIEYVWWASGHPPITETRGLTDTVGWAWEMTGTYAITVTASNPAGAVSASHVITITTPIFETYLPLVIKTVETPLGLVPASSSPERVVLLGLVTVGIVCTWKRKE